MSVPESLRSIPEDQVLASALITCLRHVGKKAMVQAPWLVKFRLKTKGTLKAEAICLGPNPKNKTHPVCSSLEQVGSFL